MALEHITCSEHGVDLHPWSKGPLHLEDAED